MRVLFVCLGNICRSPMCEAVLRHLVDQRELHDFHVDSAGTSSYHIGSDPDRRTVLKCNKHNINVKHQARQITLDDFHKFDYIFCMDNDNLKDVLDLQPKNTKAKVALFGTYDPKKELIIDDPYYGREDGFEHNFQQAMRCSVGFLDSLSL